MSRRFRYDVLLSVDKYSQLWFYFGKKLVARLKSALVFLPGHIGRQSLGVAKTRCFNICVSACVCVHVYV